MTTEETNDGCTPSFSKAGLERSVSAPAPKKGLTFRKGKREANVHAVKDGIVFYGVYLDGTNEERTDK